MEQTKIRNETEKPIRFFKGQYFSFDAIMASVIFVLALVALLSYWHSVKSFLDYQNDDLSKEAIRISNLLFAPSSSDCASVEKLGFAISWSDRRINSSILECAAKHDGAWLKDKLETPYNASIKIISVSSASINYIGEPVPAGVQNVVNIRRLATVYNFTDKTSYPVVVDLSVYR